MKKGLALAFAVLMVMMISTVAFAGPSLGFSVAPGTVAPTMLSVGWDFGNVGIEAFKADLTTPYGVWAFGVLWTPQQGSFGYRAGARLFLDWNNGPVVYQSFCFVLGVSNTWGPIRLFAEVDLAPTGLLIVIPVVGVNILFDGLLPSGKDVGL